MAFSIDTTTELGKKADHHLRHDHVAWLTTVTGDGRPVPSLIWFFYEDDGTILIYSQPNQTKLRNIASNAAVTLNFNSDPYGSSMVVLTGAAVVDESANPSANHAAYVAKYADGIASIGMTPESFSAAYSVAIRVIPSKLRGH